MSYTSYQFGKRNAGVVGDLLLDQYPASFALTMQKIKTGFSNFCTITNIANNDTTDVLVEETGTITLNSLVTAGDILGNWIGSGTARVSGWKDCYGLEVVQDDPATSPYLVENGVLKNVGGIAAIDFRDVSTRLLLGQGVPGISGDLSTPFTVYTVSALNINNHFGALFSTTIQSPGNRFVMYRDGTANKYAAILHTPPESQVVLPRNTNRLDILTPVIQIAQWDGTNLKVRANGIDGQSLAFNGSFIQNDSFLVGAQHTLASPLKGKIFEIIIRPELDDQQTIDIFENSMNARYGGNIL